jgi:hypothetical protein
MAGVQRVGVRVGGGGRGGRCQPLPIPAARAWQYTLHGAKHRGAAGGCGEPGAAQRRPLLGPRLRSWRSAPQHIASQRVTSHCIVSHRATAQGSTAQLGPGRRPLHRSAHLPWCCGWSSSSAVALSGVRGVEGGSGWISLGTCGQQAGAAAVLSARASLCAQWQHGRPGCGRRAGEATRHALLPAACCCGLRPAQAALCRSAATGGAGGWEGGLGPGRPPAPAAPAAHHDQVTAQHQDGACVAGSAAVVGGREERDEVALGKALEAVHHALVRAHDHLQPVVLRGVVVVVVCVWGGVLGVSGVGSCTASVTCLASGIHRRAIPQPARAPGTSPRGPQARTRHTHTHTPPPPSAAPTLQKSLTLSGPKVTRPGPRGLGCTPCTESLVVGSDHSRSISTCGGRGGWGVGRERRPGLSAPRSTPRALHQDAATASSHSCQHRHPHPHPRPHPPVRPPPW